MNDNTQNGNAVPYPQPMPNQGVPPVQPLPSQPLPMPNIQPVQPPVDPMAAVANLNKEEAMEEALSHTTQYSPFQVEQQVVNQTTKKGNNKKAYAFIGIIAAIMALFILLLPYISKLFGI